MNLMHDGYKDIHFLKKKTSYKDWWITAKVPRDLIVDETQKSYLIIIPSDKETEIRSFWQPKKQCLDNNKNLDYIIISCPQNQFRVEKIYNSKDSFYFTRKLNFINIKRCFIALNIFFREWARNLGRVIKNVYKDFNKIFQKLLLNLMNQKNDDLNHDKTMKHNVSHFESNFEYANVNENKIENSEYYNQKNKIESKITNKELLDWANEIDDYKKDG